MMFKQGDIIRRTGKPAGGIGEVGDTGVVIRADHNSMVVRWFTRPDETGLYSDAFLPLRRRFEVVTDV